MDSFSPPPPDPYRPLEPDSVTREPKGPIIDSPFAESTTPNDTRTSPSSLASVFNPNNFFTPSFFDKISLGSPTPVSPNRVPLTQPKSPKGRDVQLPPSKDQDFFFRVPISEPPKNAKLTPSAISKKEVPLPSAKKVKEEISQKIETQPKTVAQPTPNFNTRVGKIPIPKKRYLAPLPPDESFLMEGQSSQVPYLDELKDKLKSIEARLSSSNPTEQVPKEAQRAVATKPLVQKKLSSVSDPVLADTAASLSNSFSELEKAYREPSSTTNDQRTLVPSTIVDSTKRDELSEEIDSLNMVGPQPSSDPVDKKGSDIQDAIARWF